MVRITKVMQAKHAESLSLWTQNFRDQACNLPLSKLSSFLSTFPTRWPFPRGDLYHWINLLNRFDDILEQFCKTYKLDEGPQLIEFGTLLIDSDRLKSNGESSEDTDEQLIQSILKFSRVLLQNCGNRSIYASSSHIDSLLNTTSLSLLESVLSLGSELAQRYQAAAKRMSITSRSVNNSLLQSHYNIPLEKVVKLAMPFSRNATNSIENMSANPSNQFMKGKEKIFQYSTVLSSKSTTTTLCANDLVSIVKGGTGIEGTQRDACNKIENSSLSTETYWNEWGDVKLIYYPKLQSDIDGSGSVFTSNLPTTTPNSPTTSRRSSNLTPRGQRSSKLSTLETSTTSTSGTTTHSSAEEILRPNFKVIEVPQSKLISTDIHTLLRDNTAGLSKELKYELLAKLRIARALTSSLDTRHQIIAIRILAITNLAYIYPDSLFQELVLKNNHEQPRRLHLVYQLAELVHPPTEGDVAVPRKLQAMAFAALEALQASQKMITDVCAALNTNVNHGVLLYIVRKAVAEMDKADNGDHDTIDDEWRDCLFSLLSSISMIHRNALDLITAGLIQILIDILNQRTTIAERYYPMVLNFLDNIMCNARDGFQTLVNENGLDAISDLIVYQVRIAADNVSSGKGTPQEYRSSIVDYDIPFYQQQTIKWLFKFIHHLMSAAGGFGGNFDRLLRNLIDSSQLLASLRQIIGNANCYGSIVWTNAVSILNDFINNEPTSYVVIAEAGLSKGFLEAITGKTIKMPDQTKSEDLPVGIVNSEDDTTSPLLRMQSDSDEETPHVEHLSLNMLKATRKWPLAKGILPTFESINIIPQAFSAICLNTAGMKMFLVSNALESFFEIFESKQHVKCMEIHKDLPATLGSSFDELARHHPGLKNSIIIAIANMVARVEYLSSSKAIENMTGARLWSLTGAGQTILTNGKNTSSSSNISVNQHPETCDDGTDIEMQDADADTNVSLNAHMDTSQSTTDVSQATMTPYICSAIKFLSSILSNNSIRSGFCVMGGIENVLSLSQSPSLEYDFWDSTLSLTVHQVIAILAESKPHLTIPSLLKRALKAVDDLQSFVNFDGTSAFFAPFVDPECQTTTQTEVLSKGTSFAKALVSIHSLVSTIPTCFQSPPYNHRGSSSVFYQINVADYCIQLVQALGPLLAASLREVFKLRNTVPYHWKDANSLESSLTSYFSSFSLAGTRSPQSGESNESHPTLTTDTSNVGEKSSTFTNSNSSEIPSGTIPKSEMQSPAFKNYIVLKFLLKKLPRIISPFFQTLGKVLMAKRTLEPFQKQYHLAIADTLADSFLKQMTVEENFEENPNPADTYTYWLAMIAVLHELLLESSHQSERHSHTITLVVQAFKNRGGFYRLNQILNIFAKVICTDGGTNISIQESALRVELATSGTISILCLYGNLVNGVNFVEAPQTTALITRTERDRSGLEKFSASQFLIELRMMILPTVRRLWSSDLIEKGSSQVSERLIHVIRMIALADSEANPIITLNEVSPRLKIAHKAFKTNQDSLTTLLNQGYTRSLATEALYRCNNTLTFALEYCKELKDEEDLSRRNPIPDKDIDYPTGAEVTPGPSTTVPNNASGLVIDHPMGQETVPEDLETFNPETPLPGNDFANLDRLLTSLVPVSTPVPNTVTGLSETNSSQVPIENYQKNIDDLNEERALISENLIDKCLDVINANGEVTFDIADLIMTIVNKSSDPPTQQKSIGETLVVALMSFVGDDDFSKSGKKIAAYAHLLALLLREKAFYTATVPELKQNLESLLMFIKISPKHVPEEPSPWIPHILLIIELLLSEDAKPLKTKWTPPIDENSTIDVPEVETPELSVPLEQRMNLLEVIFEILPRIGKDEPLALSVLRVLVILSRTREIAQSMGEKKNIQRLFVMAKQLAGVSSARIHSPLMLTLRHIVEDHDMVKQIMKSEIRSCLEPIRTQRNFDENTYLRLLAFTALRNPDLFVEATNENVKLNRWVYLSANSPSRNYSLVLKNTPVEAPQIPPIDTVLPTVQATEDLSIHDSIPRKEILDSETQDNTKINHEQKVPILENPDGVIHFLLCELMNYRDVEEKEHSNNTSSILEKACMVFNSDVSMGGTSISPLPSPTSGDNRNSNSASKKEFKAEEHPIYIYRCFILQCLTELLCSYNRTKIEFINFKRSSQPQVSTSAKPRSSVVNYLLYDLIPIGTLEHAESTYLQKKSHTSTWANNVIVALLCKTNEQPINKARDPYDTEVEPDLLFVRRFVLENILKAYKDAISSNEPLDTKYSRLLGLAELMTNIMQGKENFLITDQSILNASQRQLRRIMFEKGYITALTSSISDIDLNFPGAKRAVKYILRPLKTLTQTAIALSELSLINTVPGQSVEEDIESAKSISESEDEREETPDLFRNSTLGMFEHGNEDSESQSADDVDEEMEGTYDEYVDEMDYDDGEIDENDEDDISDEDEIEIEGIGSIEGLPGDHQVEVEVFMNDHDDDHDLSPDNEDDSGSGDDNEDDDHRVEVIEELEDMQHQFNDDDDFVDEWESDGQDDEDEDGDVEDYAATYVDHEEESAAINIGAMSHLVRALGEDPAALEMLGRIAEGEENEGERVVPEYAEEDEEDDDENAEEEDDDIFDHQYPIDNSSGNVTFGWPPEIRTVVPSRHRSRGSFSPFPSFPGGPRNPLGVPSISYRPHRPGIPLSRSVDDGVNPLLQRNNLENRVTSNRQPLMGAWIPAVRGSSNNDVLDIGFTTQTGNTGNGPSTTQFLEDVIRTLPLPGHFGRHGQALQLHITTSGSGSRFLPSELEAFFGNRHTRFEERRNAPELVSVTSFTAKSTISRWAEEAKIIFGSSWVDRAADLSNTLLSLLVPPAIEADKAQKAAQLERSRQEKKFAERRAEEERLEKAAKAEEEKMVREMEEQEPQEDESANERANDQNNLNQEPPPENNNVESENENPGAGPELMEGVEIELPENTNPTPSASSEVRARVMTVIRGNTFDITDLGIDADFLAELPEEIREEVIMSTVAERRSQAAATGVQPSEIDQEFLNALPDDIRDEIIQQERRDRRRREREERNRQATASNGGPPVADMDAATILATLDPSFRNQVLMEQDDATLALLPPEMADQARAAMRDLTGSVRLQNSNELRHPTIAHASNPHGPRDSSNQRPIRRSSVQILDKPGIATLLRLMFIPQHGTLRNTLNSVLQNVSTNKINRQEILNTLLQILQDGSIDINAVERSFAYLSLKAKQPKEIQTKTSQTLKRSLTRSSSFPQLNLDVSPLMVVSQCLCTLLYLNQFNQQIPAYFLMEHEFVGGVKRTSSRKGKGKENKASKFAINTLLGLLNRDLIMESSIIMESLSSLLNMITLPLQVLQRKNKDAEVVVTEAPQSISGIVASVASPETSSTSNEQPSEQNAGTSDPNIVPAQNLFQVSLTTPVELESSIPPPETSITKIDTTIKQPEKKQRTILPPVIPDHNLKLVINIFVARECSSKTFRETLSTIKNLSAIPDAKTIFGRELVSKAQSLGEIILVDLQELLPHIQKATSGTEIQGVALAKFSPGGSDQNKLLRVLTALDHLFDPKREKKEKPEEQQSETNSSQLNVKKDLLSSLYENSTFGRMWQMLSACLNAIRQREHMLNVATILLPLIEALMVVCKNMTKDIPSSNLHQGKELILTSPPPDSRIESLFFSFTEEHRKILNDLVRHTPKLMSGTFSLLVKNPKVLDFDNKRNYFNRSIHAKTSNSRETYPTLQLSVRRDLVFHDSFKSLYFQSGDQMKYGKLSIRFHGEEGVDAGGVTREWFQVLSRQMFDPGYALFIPVSSDRTTFHPNQLSSVNEEHLMFFKFIGRIIGKALYEGRVLDCHFSRAVYKRILGKAVSLKDMESLDPDYYKSLIWMLENDITDIITETFSVDSDKFGVNETIDFIPNGRNVNVTEENKHEYVRLMVEWRLTGSVKEQLDEFLKGFHDIVPADLVSIFNEQELELLVSGLPEINVDEWKGNTEYHNYTTSSPQIQWFWRAVRSFDKEERAKLLQFVTGTSKVPLNGFKELEGMNGFSRFNIHRDYGNKNRLPSSHTCFNQLDLPEYESYETLRQQLLTAITAGSDYFGFA